MNKVISVVSLLSVALLSGCAEKVNTDGNGDGGQTTPPPVDPPVETVEEKPVVLWIDAEANFSRLRNQANIRRYLDMADDAGFNTIVVDVKPVQGDVLYDSDFLPPCTSLGGTTIENRGFDYLQFFIDEAKARGMKVTVSTTIMTMGLPRTQTGPGYEDPYWDDKFCVEYLPDGLHDIRESTAWDVFAFLNPVLPEVREYVLKMVSEIVTKYDFDGYCLDYCRYMNINSDFSEASRKAFEEYAGVKVENFPEDIYTFNSSSKTDIKPGKYYNKWVEWRATVIQSYVKDIKETIKAIKPEVDLEYWAASWWPLPHTGQNWASPEVNMSSSYWWSTPDYYKTGFADQLDIFQLGAYLSVIDDLNNPESVAYAIQRAKSLINDDCTLYGTIACSDPSFDIQRAVTLCLEETAGVMVFELSHIMSTNAWDKIKAGVDEAWEKLGVTKDKDTSQTGISHN